MKIDIRTNKTGYVINIEGAVKDNGESSYINTQEFKMLETIGEALLGYKVAVTRK